MKNNRIINVQQILAGEIGMDTQTRFHLNGDVNIYPCPWADGQVTRGGCVSPRGRMTIEEDGTSYFKAYRSDTGPRHIQLYETAHGTLKITRPRYRGANSRRRLNEEFVYVTFKFPKSIGLAHMKSLYEEETDQILAYLKTRKEETIWK